MSLRILVTNDDGINAPGLKIAEQIAYEICGDQGKVVTVAPAVDQSGVGHSISYLRPSLITKETDNDTNDMRNELKSFFKELKENKGKNEVVSANDLMSVSGTQNMFSQL